MEEKKNTSSKDRGKERGRKEKRKRKNNNKTRKGEAGLAKGVKRVERAFTLVILFFSFPSGKMEKKRR